MEPVTMSPLEMLLLLVSWNGCCYVAVSKGVNQNQMLCIKKYFANCNFNCNFWVTLHDYKAVNTNCNEMKVWPFWIWIAATSYFFTYQKITFCQIYFYFFASVWWSTYSHLQKQFSLFRMIYKIKMYLTTRWSFGIRKKLGGRN